MPDYTFHTLNDKEFETLANDLYAALSGQHVERFKAGRDQGIDGRLFSADNKTTIIQSKHWLKSGIKALVNGLKNIELPKIKK